MTSQIPLTDVAWQHHQVHAEIMAKFNLLLNDPNCDGAAFTAELETAFEKHYGDNWHAVAVQSGSAAQMLLLKAHGIGPGAEVITAPNSDLATTAAISRTGASFVLADLEAGTFNLSAEAVEAAITPATMAVVAVHMYGLPARMDSLLAVAQKHGLLLIEDATLALGAHYRQQRVGTFGDSAFFSFAPRKILGGIGNGGMVLTKHPDVAERIRRLRGYGLEPADQDGPIRNRLSQGSSLHVVEGYNLRLDGIHAAITSAKFRHVDTWAELRRASALHYHNLLQNLPGVDLPAPLPGSLPAWRNYPLLTNERDGLRSHLVERGIAAATLYSPPVHLQPVYQHHGWKEGSFPVAEAQAPRILCLPMHPGLQHETRLRIGNAVRAYLGAGTSGPGSSYPAGIPPGKEQVTQHE